jgi:putative transposase
VAVPTTRRSGSDDPAEQVALFRYRVVAEPANPRLPAAERGRLVRALAAQTHAHPDGTMRAYSRGTLDRWIAAYQALGLGGLRPKQRADAGQVRRRPELLAEAAALRAEQPARCRQHLPEPDTYPAP